LTPFGKAVGFIIVLGAAIGGWRFWQSQRSSATGGFSVSLPQMPGSSGAGGTEIELLTSASKKGWLQDEIDKFNTAHQGQYHITPQYLETRDAMHAILEGREHPVLWSPSSVIWANRLATAWPSHHEGSIID